MATKSALTKANDPQSNRLSNPLLADQVIHPDLKPAFDALVKVAAGAHYIEFLYAEMQNLKEERGLPTADEWPDSLAIARDRAQHAEWAKATMEEAAKRGDDIVVCGFSEPRWAFALRDWTECYEGWCNNVAKARAAVAAPAVVAIMDAGEVRPSHRWTTQTIIDLDALASLLHPVGKFGPDGFGIVRAGLPALPAEFRARTDAVVRRFAEIRAIPADKKGGRPSDRHKPEAPTTIINGFPGMTHSAYDIRLARTRTACLESSGDYKAALQRLREWGHEIGQETYFAHLRVLDKRDPGWRDGVIHSDSGASGKSEFVLGVSQRRKHRGN